MTVNTRDNIAAGKYDVSYDGTPKRGTEAYKLWKQAKRLEEADASAAFVADLEVEFNMVGHPKAAEVFGKAWEHGHSSGRAEVVNYYEEFAGLAGEAPDATKTLMARLTGIIALIDASNNGKGANTPFAHQIREIATGQRAPTDF